MSSKEAGINRREFITGPMAAMFPVPRIAREQTPLSELSETERIVKIREAMKLEMGSLAAVADIRLDILMQAETVLIPFKNMTNRALQQELNFLLSNISPLKANASLLNAGCNEILSKIDGALTLGSLKNLQTQGDLLINKIEMLVQGTGILIQLVNRFLVKYKTNAI